MCFPLRKAHDEHQCNAIDDRRNSIVFMHIPERAAYLRMTIHTELCSPRRASLRHATAVCGESCLELERRGRNSCLSWNRHKLIRSAPNA